MGHRKPIRVAFQGEPGAFSHAAALKLVGDRLQLMPCASFQGVFEALRKNAADYAVIPIENTLHGSVHENYDHLVTYDFAISGETSLRISHQLIAPPGRPMAKIKRVYSHPVALSQCKQFFADRSGLVPVPYYDTAGSVKHVMEELGEEDIAAIASEQAALTYGAAVIRRNIEDIRQNFTRFFLLTKQQTHLRRADGEPKTSLVFATANQPGSLFRALACFALRDLSLTKIESRPFRGKPWEYLFYVDFLGSAREKSVQNALSHLRECTQFVKLLGSYRPTL